MESKGLIIFAIRAFEPLMSILQVSAVIKRLQRIAEYYYTIARQKQIFFHDFDRSKPGNQVEHSNKHTRSLQDGCNLNLPSHAPAGYGEVI